MRARIGWRAAAAMLLVAGTLVSVGGSGRPSAATEPRNVVVIQVDDMRTDELQYLTKTLALLPGTNFTNSYVSTSICCPSRAAFLSGQYTQNNKVKTNGGYSNFKHSNTLAAWLHNAGYFTGIVGKYLNGYGCKSAVPAGWDHWQALCANVYGMYSYSLRDGATVVKYGTTSSEYQTDVLAQRSVATVTEAADSGKPFFLYLTPTAPHAGTNKLATAATRVAPRYANAMSGFQLSPNPNFNEADVSDKPAWVQALPSITSAQVAAITSSELTRIRMLLAVDDLVENVVNQLSATGKLATTDIMFTSDNGFALGEHRIRFGKEVEFNEVLSVPLLASGPDFPVGVNSSLVQNTDLAPTITALTGVTAGRVMDGRSIMPVVDGTADWSRRAIRHFIAPDKTIDNSTLATPPHPSGDGVRATHYAYYALSTGEKELYDRATDPWELTNLAGQPKYATLQASMHALLLKLKTCIGAACQLDLADIPLTARASVSCSSLVCDFSGANSFVMDGSIVSYDWTFGDGGSATGISPTHTYQASGSYPVALTVTDDQGNTATDTLTVAANLPPVAAFGESCTDLSCVFDSSGSSDPDGTISAYSWGFGDGTTSTAANPSHDYATSGTRTVTLTVTDDRGAQTSASHSVTVTAPNVLPSASFTPSCTGLDCSFDASASNDSDGSIASYAWDFGDGSTGSGVAPSHTYASSGVYAITLLVTDDRGGTGTVTIPISV